MIDGLQPPAVPAPHVGEHTDEVLAHALCLSSQDLAELRADGILG